MMSNLESRELEWFINTMRKEFGVHVEITEIGYEALELYTNEVENFFVPSELFEEVPESFIYELMIFDDEEENVWVGAIAFFPNSPDWCLQVITKNGEMVLRNVPLL